MTQRATYVYCLVRSAEAPSLKGVPAGLPGVSAVRLLEVRKSGGDGKDGLWLAVADAPLPDYAAEAIEGRLQDLSWVSDRALAHEAVIEFFLGRATVLPMKLFTLFSSEEKAQRDLAADVARLHRVLDRVEGCSEWGVRVHLDEARAREAQARELRPGERDASGTGFLLRKKREQEAARGLSARLRSEMDEVFAELARTASDSLRRAPVPGEAGARLLLDGAFLVHSSHTAQFETGVQRCAERLAGLGCEVTLTGPWPAYHFLEEKP
ncbi:MAG TPA: GvpL/GvpF family gas vesicle protein [Thermoanaerobaculia bacterium]|nr:GvpL/GvpF family gas vesicle protein [Thermoanaerobaculia bacterium]